MVWLDRILTGLEALPIPVKLPRREVELALMVQNNNINAWRS